MTASGGRACEWANERPQASGSTWVDGPEGEPNGGHRGWHELSLPRAPRNIEPVLQQLGQAKDTAAEKQLISFT